MALSHERLGVQVPLASKVPQSVTTEFDLLPGEPVSLGESRPDNVGAPDFDSLVLRSRLTPDNLPDPELHGFSAYRKSGGILSEGLYKDLMEGVIYLQEPGARESSKFASGTLSQVKGFEDSHNKPFPPSLPLPEKQIFLTQVQKDAYCLLREGRLLISDEDRYIVNDPREFSDKPLFEHILKMPTLESYLLSKQEQPPLLIEAA